MKTLVVIYLIYPRIKKRISDGGKYLRKYIDAKNKTYFLFVSTNSCLYNEVPLPHSISSTSCFSISISNKPLHWSMVPSNEIKNLKKKKEIILQQLIPKMDMQLHNIIGWSRCIEVLSWQSLVLTFLA